MSKPYCVRWEIKNDRLQYVAQKDGSKYKALREYDRGSVKEPWCLCDSVLKLNTTTQRPGDTLLNL